MAKKTFILPFKQLMNKDVGKVGGKNASLGEMYQKLTKRGINVPDGFAVTASAYRFFMQKAGSKTWSNCRLLFYSRSPSKTEGSTSLRSVTSNPGTLDISLLMAPLAFELPSQARRLIPETTSQVMSEVMVSFTSALPSR